MLWRITGLNDFSALYRKSTKKLWWWHGSRGVIPISNKSERDCVVPDQSRAPFGLQRVEGVGAAAQ
jgi:hypothetical protein